MNTPNLYFAVAIGIFFSVLVSVAGYCYFRSRRSSKASWEELLARLTWIDRDNIAQIALNLVDESGQRKGVEDAGNLEPGQIWSLVGGLEGLEVLERNSQVIIDLAFYVQQRYPEALPIAERLRLDARELNWHIARLKGAAQRGNLRVSFPFYAQRAVVTYYLMTRRLLSLYEAGNFPMFADLQRAI